MKKGKVLLMLCDTIYGLVSKAPATYPTLLRIKGRPETKPFLQLFADLEQLAAGPWQLPPKELQQYWPGPLTCVLGPKSGEENQSSRQYIRSTEPYCRQDSQAVRIPKHRLLQELCRAVGGPLYSSSANRSGEPVPETTRELREVFAPEIAEGLILPYFPGPETETEKAASTIVDARCRPLRILRQGDLKLHNFQ
ncbi:L-threonylcarbamoyladenylate synthase [Candidatus Haliotispira prima]|uniref:L-threonylcarbamoyladenylate synthase n=1 Tax=Candidatus Haliotispira prima TaxID=3034016 RepID=A0ABY8MJE3_9SPIO|nr:L-threonylcarbamoyladenylate synthase [Candidatus Haliotispira prima]